MILQQLLESEVELLLGRARYERTAALLDPVASRGWRGITMTPKAVAGIERLRRALAAGEPLPATHLDEEVIAAWAV